MGSIVLGSPKHQVVKHASGSAPSISPSSIESWFPRRTVGLREIVEPENCHWKNLNIDAILFAQFLVAGKTGPYVLNGGMMCDSFHYLGTSGLKNFTNTIIMISGFKGD